MTGYRDTNMTPNGISAAGNGGCRAVKPGEDVVYSEVNISDRSCGQQDGESDSNSNEEEARNRLRSQGKEYGRRCYKYITAFLAVLCVALLITVLYQGVNSKNSTKDQHCSSLQKDKEEIQKNHDALLSKFPLAQKYCHTTETGLRVCDPCPQGWKEHNGQCYYFSTSVTTWNESQNNCIKEAAHLVIVNSEEEQDFISSERSSSYWIGLTDSAEERVWRWVDGTDLKQGFWLYGEPDNKDQQSAGKTANCVINRREWRDEPCEDQYRWICETQTLAPKPLHM